MRVPIGPRLKRRRRRRAGKAAVLAAVLVLFAAVLSMTTWDKPVPGRWDDPSDDELYTARRYYEINGENGDSIAYLNRYPAKYAPFIRGEVDSISECEQ